MSWIELGRVAPERLDRARLALHWAAQLPSAVGASLLPARGDGAHACLGWLASHRALAGPLIPGNVPFRAALRVPDLCLLVLDAEGAELAQRPEAKAMVPDLIRRAEGSDVHAGQGAAETLGYLRTKAALPVLVRLLEHDDRWLRFKAAKAIKNMGSAARSAGDTCWSTSTGRSSTSCAFSPR